MEEQAGTSLGRTAVQLRSFCDWIRLRVAIAVEEARRSLRQFRIRLPSHTIAFQRNQPLKVGNGFHSRLLRSTQPVSYWLLWGLAQQGQLYGPTPQKIARILEGLRILAQDKKEDREIAETGRVEVQIRCWLWRRGRRRHADCSQWSLVVLLIKYARVYHFFLKRRLNFYWAERNAGLAAGFSSSTFCFFSGSPATSSLNSSGRVRLCPF